MDWIVDGKEYHDWNQYQEALRRRDQRQAEERAARAQRESKQQEQNQAQNQAQSRGKVMEWEYIVVTHGWLYGSNHDGNSISAFLNEKGKDGWELVGQEQILKQDKVIGRWGRTDNKYQGAWLKRTEKEYDDEVHYGQMIFWMFFFKRPKR